MKKLKIPRKPKGHEADPMVLRDEKISRCELLILKGIHKQVDLAKELDVSVDTVRSYIACVYSRWEIAGTRRNLQRARGEGLSRLNGLCKNLWEIVNDENCSAERRLRALKQVLSVHDRILFLNGVTKRKLEELPQESIDSSEESVSERIRIHQERKALANKFLSFIGEKNQA